MNLVLLSRHDLSVSSRSTNGDTSAPGVHGETTSARLSYGRVRFIWTLHEGFCDLAMSGGIGIVEIHLCSVVYELSVGSLQRSPSHWSTHWERGLSLESPLEFLQSGSQCSSCTTNTSFRNTLTSISRSLT